MHWDFPAHDFTASACFAGLWRFPFVKVKLPDSGQEGESA
jgi:hypothetical protein